MQGDDTHRLASSVRLLPVVHHPLCLRLAELAAVHQVGLALAGVERGQRQAQGRDVVQPGAMAERGHSVDGLALLSVDIAQEGVEAIEFLDANPPVPLSFIDFAVGMITIDALAASP